MTILFKIIFAIFIIALALFFIYIPIIKNRGCNCDKCKNNLHDDDDDIRLTDIPFKH